MLDDIITQLQDMIATQSQAILGDTSRTLIQRAEAIRQIALSLDEVIKILESMRTTLNATDVAQSLDSTVIRAWQTGYVSPPVLQQPPVQ